MTEAYEKATRQLDHQVELYNKKVHRKPYEVGNHVWVLFPQAPKGKSKKLYRPWSGPFVVTKRLSDLTFGVQDVNNQRRMVVHLYRLKPHKQTVQTPVKDRAKRTNHHKTAHYQGITLVLSWNSWMTNARTVSQLSAEMILHRQGQGTRLDIWYLLAQWGACFRLSQYAIRNCIRQPSPDGLTAVILYL